MPTWLIALEVGLMALNAMTPVIQAIIQQIVSSQNGAPTSAQTALLWSTYLNAVVKAELGPVSS